MHGIKALGARKKWADRGRRRQETESLDLPRPDGLLRAYTYRHCLVLAGRRLVAGRYFFLPPPTDSQTPDTLTRGHVGTCHI